MEIQVLKKCGTCQKKYNLLKFTQHVCKLGFTKSAAKSLAARKKGKK